MVTVGRGRYTVTGVSLEAAQRAKLDDIARLELRSRSEVLRAAIDLYVAHWDKKRRALELAQAKAQP